MHMFLSSCTSLPPSTPSHLSRSSQSTGSELPVSYSKFHRLTNFTYGNICQCSSFNLSHPLLPHLCPWVCSLWLCLQCCHENRFISTIFLDSIYMLTRNICFCSFLPITIFHFVQLLGTSFCWIGCCLIDEILNKANKNFKIYLVSWKE